ncbi:hypothetical protein [Hydrogenophaga sp. 2FB]|uniref:hypothetical protein n=1 Tax=Hydrogenophaga sp. 2FB TaxID=2502187 RepID=UPI0010F80E52|nr:hypothetical protein [Hydrogenophaga sp. 2FB]
MTTKEAAMLVRSAARSWAGWEAGTRPMPPAKLELLSSRIQAMGSPRPEVELVVVLALHQGSAQAIDVVATDGFVGLDLAPDGLSGVIKSLSIHPPSGRPCIHRTRFVTANNQHVINAVARWVSLVD